jgi:hypothetical protein
MEVVSDGFLDNTYNTLAQEQTRMLTEMRNNPDTFKQNERLHSHIGIIMKDILKFKNTRTKIRNISS